MKHLITALAITSTLLLAQGCSSGERHSSDTTKSHEGHAVEGETSASPPANPHEGHAMGNMAHGEESTAAQAKLSIPKDVVPNRPVPLVIDIQDSSGKAIAFFDTFQEKLMHLIIVSDNLQLFSHIHPAYKEKGRFEVETSFPQSGSYTLFSDYKPTGQKEQVSVLKAQVSGNSPSASPIDRNPAKTFGTTKVNLTFSQPTLKAGQDVTLMFNLQDASSRKPVTDLQPYLGEQGHLVIVKQSSPLTKSDYIHAHAAKNTSDEQIHFMTSFPEPGNYKLWGQFNRNGKIVTADFWVNVI